MSQFLAGNGVEHVLDIYGQQYSCWEEAVFLSFGDVLLHTQAHCDDDEVHASIHSKCMVKGEKMFGKMSAVQMLGCDPSQS